MELQVTITLSDKLFALLEDKLPNLGRRVEKAVTKELGARARQESNIAIAVSTDNPAAETEQGESDNPRHTRRAKADKPEPATEEAAQPADETPAQQSEKELTEEDIRAAMHRTRQRFEGEDYKDNADSEDYKKYHKQLTSMFKQIASVLGADKPSALPADKRAAFIAECDALIIDEKGLITPPPAPF